ncbi:MULTISPECIES: hypothetical protein [unclassified Adlercreutzia]|uniref:hypothetical protein n=1 Tax=unclassified Adlercreutzia TaxID=2636013 RepID=UPI0013EC8ABA|nr:MULTISPECIES: hypothetical protein [unclassified Adlercreutzia]
MKAMLIPTGLPREIEACWFEDLQEAKQVAERFGTPKSIMSGPAETLRIRTQAKR